MKRLSSFEQHYTVKDAARLMSVSVRTVWKELRSRSIRPYIKIGKCVRIPASALERFVEERAV